MVVGFRHSLSLPGAIPRGSPARNEGQVPEKSYHVRSASLPCHSHPIISEVENGIRNLRSWKSETGFGSLYAGLVMIENLLTSINDLFRLPKSQESLLGRSFWTDRLLEDFLLLVDAHGIFRSAVMALKQHQSTAQAAIRRRDEASLTSCAKSQRGIEKELGKLASALRKVSRPFSSVNLLCTLDADEAELAGILQEAILVIVSTSASVFVVLSTSASSTTCAVMTSYSTSAEDSWMVSPLKKFSSFSKKNVVRKEEQSTKSLQYLEELEECLQVLEIKSQLVFRTLMNVRVALLNILTL